MRQPLCGTSPTAPVEVVKLAKGAPRPCYAKYYHINIRSTYVFPSKPFNLTRQMEHFPNLLDSFDIHCTSGKGSIGNIWKGVWPFRKKRRSDKSSVHLLQNNFLYCQLSELSNSSRLLIDVRGEISCTSLLGTERRHTKVFS